MWTSCSQIIYLGPHTYLELLLKLILPCHSFEGTVDNVHKPSKLNAIKRTLPHMQIYCSPYAQTNIHQLEMIQRKAARFVFNNYSQNSSITKMLNKSLEKWRDKSILVTYKIILKSVCKCLLWSCSSYCPQYHCSSRKFLHLPSRIDSYLHSFFPRAICLSNHLRDHLVEIDDVDTFKSLL